MKIKNSFQSKWLIFTIIVIGFGMRLLVTIRGHNYDLDSYMIISDIVDSGYNVYASTSRYNYGPIWFHILHYIYLLASKNQDIFRYLLVTFLSLVDVGIFAILWRRLGSVVACLFFLNPISIIITGYHNQFDNFAILLGMFSVTLIGNDFDKNINNRKILGLLTLGLSLATKHILFVFPFWLAIKQKRISQKIVMIFIPVAIFILGFIPYWNEGRQGIIQNVFLYQSWNNEFFYRLFVPQIFQFIFPSWMVWILILFIFAFFFRKKNGFESLLLYTCILVGASPAITNQYLAIPVPFVSAYLNPFTLLYTVVGSWYLLVDSNGLHISVLQQLTNISRDAYYAILISMLCLGFVLSVWPQQLNALYKRILLEIKVHFGYEKRE